jgi:hypothetical protein
MRAFLAALWVVEETPTACSLDEAPAFAGPAIGAVTTPGRECVEIRRVLAVWNEP